MKKTFNISQECSKTSWKLNVILKNKIKTYSEKTTIQMWRKIIDDYRL